MLLNCAIYVSFKLLAGTALTIRASYMHNHSFRWWFKVNRRTVLGSQLSSKLELYPLELAGGKDL